jgi:Uma2 family endonuclease
MSKSLPERQMTSEEFLAWAQAQDAGRFELHGGHVVAMSPERAEHVEVKQNVFLALRDALRASSLPCFAYTDGLAVRIDAATTFEPDAQVVCGEKVPGDAVATNNPVIVVEVLSPSTSYTDLGPKVEGYFRVASIQHYLIVDPQTRRIVHHRRGQGDVLETRIGAQGAMSIDPPGLTLQVEDVFAGLA